MFIAMVISAWILRYPSVPREAKWTSPMTPDSHRRRSSVWEVGRWR
jgi:hypothetical protein